LEAKKKVSSVLADSLAAMSIPSERDLDEVYETLYKLKKRVRSLEREVNSLKAGIEKHSQPEVLHEAV
jgi:cell division protein FtsB